MMTNERQSLFLCFSPSSMYNTHTYIVVCNVCDEWQLDKFNTSYPMPRTRYYTFIRSKQFLSYMTIAHSLTYFFLSVLCARVNAYVCVCFFVEFYWSFC